MLALGGGVVAGCGDEESPGSEAAGGGPPAPTAEEEVPADQLPSEVTLAEILANPEQYTGQQVTVSGEVAQVVVQPGAFTLGESVETEGEAGPCGCSQPPDRPPDPCQPDDAVVSGGAPEGSPNLSIRSARSAMSTEFESARPLRRRLSVLMSVGVLAVGGGAVAGCGDDEESPGSGASGGGQTAPSTTQEQVPASGVTVADILANPQQYTGQQVTVIGEIAQIVVEPGVVTIGDGGVEEPNGGEGDQEGLGELVVLPTQGVQFPEEEIGGGDIVRVQGTVQLISANIAEEDDFLFEDAGDTAFLEQFQNQSAVVATQVQSETPPVLEDRPQESPPGE